MELLAGAFGATINYTRVKLGAGSVDIADLEAQVDVTNYVKDFQIIRTETSGATSIVTVRLNNNGITQPTLISQMGLFAQVNDGPEVLLVIFQTDTPSTAPTPEQQPGWIFEAGLNVIISNVANVTANIDWSAFATIEDIAIATENLAPKSHIADLIKTENGVHGIRYYNNKLQAFNGLDWEDIVSDDLKDFHYTETGEMLYNLINCGGGIETPPVVAMPPSGITISGETINLTPQSFAANTPDLSGVNFVFFDGFVEYDAANEALILNL